jgi:asparagine synthase (glutamine-hydrolysing)
MVLSQKIEDEISKKLSDLLEKSIVTKIPRRKFGLLLSGGLDSSIIAFILKKNKEEFRCYTIEINNGNFKKSEDVEYSIRFSKDLNLDTKIIYSTEEELEDAVISIIKLIPNIDTTKLSIALPMFLCFKQAKRDGCEDIFVGTGCDTVFAGFNKYKRIENINEACEQDLKEIFKKIDSRELILARDIGLNLIFPFLDKNIIEYSLTIPQEYKIKSGIEKYILRKTAEKMGVQGFITNRKKKAIQYSSNSQKSLKKLAKKSGFRKISGYLDYLKKKLDSKN